MYATVEHLRDEGVTESQASDERLTLLIDEAGRSIDHYCGWFFEPRPLVLTMCGRGLASIEPDYPPIELTSIRVNDIEIDRLPENVDIMGAPVVPPFRGPRITRHDGIFSVGDRNVIVSGIFGYTEDDGTPHGRTPLEIRRACMLLVLRWLSPLNDDDGDARNKWRLIEERTRDQSYRLGPTQMATGLTGDPDIDDLLNRYKRPPRMGAV